MSVELGSEDRSLRVAIVGSGPSGFYVAQSLLRADIFVSVDMFEKLPAPYGLVRYGVAPDHARIKKVVKVYEKIAGLPGFSFFGNVNIGKDIKVEELKKFYDAVVFAFGAQADRRLGIPGEQLAGSYTATEFVNWYNGHPDYKDYKFDLSGESAVIIGQGNVAVDVCRILCKTVDELKATDITQDALDALSKSNIKEIHMVGRRGPVHAAFTPFELSEFGDLQDCDVFVGKEDLDLCEHCRTELEDFANVQQKKNVEILKEYSSRTSSGKHKKLIMHFLKSPQALIGEKKVEKLILERNELKGEAGKRKARGTGWKEELKCDVFFQSIGYHGEALEGLPFHESCGVVPSREGRIQENGEVVPGFYVAGWIKRGPTGVVGTNKQDSEQTVKNLLSDVSQLMPCAQPNQEDLVKFLEKRNIRAVSFSDWEKIDAAEIARGKEKGKPREKFVSVEDMLAVLDE